MEWNPNKRVEIKGDPEMIERVIASEEKMIKRYENDPLIQEGIKTFCSFLKANNRPMPSAPEIREIIEQNS